MELPPPPAALIEENIVSDLQEQVDPAEAQEAGEALTELLNKGQTLSEAMQNMVVKYPNLIMDIHITIGVSAQGHAANGSVDIILKGDGKGGFNLASSNAKADSSEISITNGNAIVRNLLSTSVSNNPRVGVSASAAGQHMDNLAGKVNDVIIGLDDGSSHLGNVSKLANKSAFEYSDRGAPVKATIPDNIPFTYANPTQPITSPQGNSGVNITSDAKQQLTQAISQATNTPLPVARTTIDNSVPQEQSQASLETSVGTPAFAPSIFNLKQAITIPSDQNFTLEFNHPFMLADNPEIPLVITTATNGAVKVEVLNPDGTVKDNLSAEEENSKTNVLARLRYSPGDSRVTITKP